MDYPLGTHMDVKGKTGKPQSHITLDAVKNGTITPDDIKISKETLAMQGEVAKANHRPHLAENFDRAAELVGIPDDFILAIYGKLRPYRSTKGELLDIANTLTNTYGAHKCAQLFLDAVTIYEKRGVLK